MKAINEQAKKSIAWLQVTAGQGPKECSWVVAQLEKMILQAAEKKGIFAERIEALAFDKLLRKQSVIEPDAYLSLLIRLEGRDIDQFVQFWEGTIKWQGESPYRPKHKRLNWFVGIARLVMPSGQKAELEALSKEVDIESIRARGPGGQHVNKTNSAIRLTHRPTGLQLRVESDRSQHRNKKIALERLCLLLSQKESDAQKTAEHTRWLQHYDVKRGNPTRTFYGKAFSEND